MHFLSPIWFIALAAISIPVVIHLWNIKSGKILKVGSISLIAEASKTNRRSFKLLDILLLITRCLLLSVLAMFLAAPVWKYLKATEKVKGWVLIPRENLRETYKTEKVRIDSLSKAGYEFHYFNTGFEKIDLRKTLGDTTRRDTTSAVNYWNIIKQLNAKEPAHLPLYVFSDSRLTHFKGAKPTTGLNLKWQTYTPADSVGKWVEAASYTNSDAIKVTIGKSSPAVTVYTSQLIQNEGDEDVAVQVANGRPYVSLKNGSQPPFAVDTSILRIAINTDKYVLDAGYLKAALSAAIEFTGRKAIIKQYGNAAQIPGGQTWLFWLSDKPVDARWVKSSKNILKYEQGKATDVSSWINTGGKFALSDGGKKIALTKFIPSGNKSVSLWHGGFGRPILSQKNQNYSIFTHFNPSWNDLVWSDDFPKLMLKLIAPEEQDSRAEIYDKRVLSNADIQPIRTAQTHLKTSASTIDQTDLSKYFWMLLVALFITERILSHQKNKQANG